ncbi:MAG: heme ABC transporter permease [Gammaproteobacteria bacterium]|nr:heme ABC transporter permease [Gammaproteobacteria bacterium]
MNTSPSRQNVFLRFFRRLASPKYFYDFAGVWIPWLGTLALLLFLIALYGGLLITPPDYQQGDSVRIMYVHVPSAWMSLFIYVFMFFNAIISLIWRIKLSDIMANVSAPIGAAFTFLALFTGAMWGKPMWGAYWVWDARLTSEAILLFLYAGIIALNFAIEDRQTAAKATAILIIVGVVNIPIIHYSVEWWNTLHQGPTITKLDKPSITMDMLWPLLVMTLAFKFYFFTNLLMRARLELIRREKQSQWVNELLR